MLKGYLENPEIKEVKVDAAVLVGDPAEEIVTYAEKEDIGLIVMSTYGRSGIKRWAMGSVADKVLRATKQPLALIRAKHAHHDILGRTILRKILVTLDGSKQSEAVIHYAEELVTQMKQKDIAAASRVMFGSAADEIIKFADAIEAGLVAMSTHGRSGVSRWALGSVAERVLRAGNTLCFW